MWEPVRQWLLDPIHQRLFLGVAIAFTVGLMIGRWKWRIRRDHSRPAVEKGDEAFLKGVQYILSEDHDQAIEEFTKSVQLNSDTIETYIALGNLYRSKGDIDRAIRIRQNIILRPNIDESLRLRALFDLGEDYRKGGFLNRALKTFLQVVEKDPSRVKAWEIIEKIYEEMKEWESAYRTRQRIAKLARGSHNNILAHYLVELGKVYQGQGDLNKARSFYNKAISTYRRCIDAYLHLGDLHFQKQEYKKAMSTWKRVVEVDARFTFLAYRRLEGAYSKMKNLKPVQDFLMECSRFTSDSFTHLALARYLYNEANIEGALRELQTALEIAPSFWEARKFKGEILLAQSKDKEALVSYKELIEHLNVPSLTFHCTQCGFRPKDLFWQCPQCRRWDTITLSDSTKVEEPYEEKSTESEERFSQQEAEG